MVPRTTSCSGSDTTAVGLPIAHPRLVDEELGRVEEIMHPIDEQGAVLKGQAFRLFLPTEIG